VKIAITGATGFIGCHVLSRLLRENVELVAAVRNPEALSNQGGRIRVVPLDLAQAPPDAYAQLGRPDALLHLAWQGLPNYRSRHHFESELPRQYAFLRSLVEAGLPALVVTGTCFEYGLQSGQLSPGLPTHPANPYGFAKDALRQQLTFLKADTPFHLTWARLFYLFGEGQPKGSLYPLLRAAVQRGEPVFNMSGGEQLRDYLPVETVADQLVRLALLGRDLPPLNLCSGRPISVRRLVEGWIQENHWEIGLNLGHYPYPDHEPMAFWGDPRPLQAVLGPA